MHLVFLILLITLGGCLPDLIYRWRNRLRGTHQEGKITGLPHTRGWLPLNMDSPHTPWQPHTPAPSAASPRAPLRQGPRGAHQPGSSASGSPSGEEFLGPVLGGGPAPSWEVREGEAWGCTHTDTRSVLTWSLVCTRASSCSSVWPGPSFSLTGGGSKVAWASSSATCMDRKVSHSLGNLPPAQSSS